MYERHSPFQKREAISVSVPSVWRYTNKLGLKVSMVVEDSEANKELFAAKNNPARCQSNGFDKITSTVSFELPPLFSLFFEFNGMVNGIFNALIRATSTQIARHSVINFCLRRRWVRIE